MRHCYFVICLRRLYNTSYEVYEPYEYIKTKSMFGNFMYYFIKTSVTIRRAFEISEDVSLYLCCSFYILCTLVQVTP